MGGSPHALLSERKHRIAAAVALERQDRVPCVPLGDAFAAKVAGVSLADFCTKPEAALSAMLTTFTSLGEIDGIQQPSFNVYGLSRLWLSRLKVPGRDLPDDELWQVEERELMTIEDYDAIVTDGYGPWFRSFVGRHLSVEFDSFRPYAATLPHACGAWEDRGIPVLSPLAFTIPYEYFSGARSFRGLMLDLRRIPDKVEAAMDVAMPALVEKARQAMTALQPYGVWVGGWRSASEFLSPKLWERFVFPYLKQLVDAIIQEGVVPILHFDSNWGRDLTYLKDFPKGRVVLSLDGATDIFKAKEILGGHMCLMGDVPPALLALGTPEEVNAYSHRLVDEIGPTGFILAQGCCIPPNARPECVAAMISAVR